MDVNKFIKYFGLFFVILGAVVGAIGLGTSGGGAFGEASFVFIPVSAVFILVGGLFFFLGRSMVKGRERILRDGEAYAGKIFGYDSDPSVTMNGSALVVLVVRYYDGDGQIREALVSTGSANRGNYPLGATARFRLLDGKAVLEGKPTREPLSGEYELLQGGIDVTGTAPSIGVHCPNCGAVVNVPIGLGTGCPYCGSMIRLDENGEPF